MKRLNLSEDLPPSSTEEWATFLTFINNFYTETDQERYLVERSIDISSQEFLQLTNKLETAQEIARLGYWSYGQSEDSLKLSNNLYEIFDLNQKHVPGTKKEFLDLIHSEDQEKVESILTHNFIDSFQLENQARILDQKGKYNWFHISCRKHNTYDDTNKKIIGIAIDISKQKKAEEKLEETNKKLIETARLAGMTDVAISVLHNVGNTLNSANVSVDMILETLSHSGLDRLSKITSMLENHRDNLCSFLTSDPKGMLIPQYLIALNQKLQEENNNISTEVSNLSKNIQHIRSIIESQQSISKTKGNIEKIYLPDLIDDALRISGSNITNNGIEFSKNFKDVGHIESDKTKIMQIIINFFRNARESIDANPIIKNKKINLTIQKNKNNLDISVEDNGNGISPDALEQIFNFGFTTKEKGHGFGLHSSILAAKELGGDIRAESEGEGMGAKFILTIPIKQEKTSTEIPCDLERNTP